MRFTILPTLFLVLTLLLTTAMVSCMKHDQMAQMAPRVPDNKIEEAKTWKAPFGDARQASPEIAAEGKRLYEGKGSCFHCHGMSGKGDGAAASKLQHHPPRDFTNCKWHDARTDGELYWVIDHGVPGTGMVDMLHSGHLKDLEAWKIIAYLRTLCTFK